MNRNDRIVAALKPAALDVRPDPNADEHIEAIIGRSPDAAPRRPRSRRGLRPAVASMAVVLTAVLGLAGLSAFDGLPGRGRMPSSRTTPVAADAFLLAGAKEIEARPARSGAYWHVVTRRCRSGTERPMVTVHGRLSPRPGGLPYRFTACESTESWTSKKGFVRTVVGLEPKVVFASARDQANWRADGEPALTQKMRYTEHSGPLFAEWGLNGAKMSLDRLKKLPGAPAALRKVIAGSARGPIHGEELDEFVWTFGPELLSQPITPRTRAGLYRLLAGLPGVHAVAEKTDPEGRPIVLIAHSLHTRGRNGEPVIVESRLAFRKDTYEFLGEYFSDTMTDEQLVAEWTNVLGRRQGERG